MGARFVKVAALLWSVWLIPAAASAVPVPDRACVGYRFSRILDHGRPFGDEAAPSNARPIDYGFWFPVSSCRGRRTTLLDLLAESQMQAGRPVPERGRAGPSLEDMGIVDSIEAARALRQETEAIRTAASGPSINSPLVVYIHPSVLQAAPIAERLAGAGFAVASITWRGTNRQQFDVGVSGMTTEMLDAQAVVRDLAARSGILPRRIYVIGMSFGALTGLCWAQADQRIVALVTHDGGIETPTGTRLSPRCPYFSPTRPRLKLLSLYDASYAETTREVLDGLPGVQVQRVAVPLLAHSDYVGTVLLRARGDRTMDRPGERVRLFNSVADRTVEFLRCVRDYPEDECRVSEIR